MRRLRRAGLRRRAAWAFALGALCVVTVLTTTTYLLSRSYLIRQREVSALRQAFADASFVRDRLRAGDAPQEVVSDVVPRAGARALLTVGGAWYATDLADTSHDLPPAALQALSDRGASLTWWRTREGPVVVVATALPGARAGFVEVSTVEELDRTLRLLRRVLALGGALTAAAAAGLGRAVARRVLRPLDEVAGAATRIAAGELDTRLGATEDPDLVAIVAAFNTMVDAVTARLAREARFTADVSHELRTPLTALVTGVDLMQRHRDDLPARSQQALDLVSTELARFRRTLDDLLALARIDAERDSGVPLHAVTTDLRVLTREVLARTGCAQVLRDADDGRPGPWVAVDRLQVERVLVNLLENADRHGGGVRAVEVVAVGGDTAGTGDHEGWAEVRVDDAGPGVPAEDRERIFARFARGETRHGSTTGTGLGLSLVLETARRHGGRAWCTDAPGGGARFVVRLPVTEIAPDDDLEAS